MKKIIKKALQAVLLIPILALSASVIAPQLNPVGAQQDCDTGTLSLSSGADCARGNEQPENLFGEGGIFQVVTNILLFLIGAVSVIMLIFGGIRYVVSGGESTAVANAKNTILYAIVGILIAFLAYAAVNFVITQLVDNTQ